TFKTRRREDPPAAAAAAEAPAPQSPEGGPPQAPAQAKREDPPAEAAAAEAPAAQSPEGGPPQAPAQASQEAQQAGQPAAGPQGSQGATPGAASADAGPDAGREAAGKELADALQRARARRAEAEAKPSGFHGCRYQYTMLYMAGLMARVQHVAGSQQEPQAGQEPHFCSRWSSSPKTGPPRRRGKGGARNVGLEFIGFNSSSWAQAIDVLDEAATRKIVGPMHITFLQERKLSAPIAKDIEAASFNRHYTAALVPAVSGP
ncbi:unnamed protein product, partial [Prorocentrum cordatum]